MESAERRSKRDLIDRDAWHPIRILHPMDMNRSSGWPPENRDIRKMTAWCKKHLRGQWFCDVGGDAIATYWFEERGDATQFALKWFPFKCG